MYVLWILLMHPGEALSGALAHPLAALSLMAGPATLLGVVVWIALGVIAAKRPKRRWLLLAPPLLVAWALKRGRWVWGGLGLAAMAWWLTFGPVWAMDPCEGRGTAVVVDTFARNMWLCEAGEPTHSYRVALGLAGWPKVRRGDWKTPKRPEPFPLNPPRPSVSGLHIFIGIGYPDAQEIARGRRQGLTPRQLGDAVGIHGPSDRRLGWLHPWVARTAGCVAVGSNREIEEVAAWVNAQPSRPPVFIQ